MSARTVTLKVRHYDFTTITRSSTRAQPTDQPRLIAQLARRLLADVDTSAGIRLLGVGVTALADFVQDDLFGTPDATESAEPPTTPSTRHLPVTQCRTSQRRCPGARGRTCATRPTGPDGSGAAAADWSPSASKDRPPYPARSAPFLLTTRTCIRLNHRTGRCPKPDVRPARRKPVAGRSPYMMAVAADQRGCLAAGTIRRAG
jgi:hypothetical protein